MDRKGYILSEVCSHCDPMMRLESYPPKMLLMMSFLPILLRLRSSLSMREWKN